MTNENDILSFFCSKQQQKLLYKHSFSKQMLRKLCQASFYLNFKKE